jgi:cytosine/adenosine deaminase-related metal-dependent hydrolase
LVVRGSTLAPLPPEVDLVLRGGRVIDPETGFDEVADVAIGGGTVVHVGAYAVSAASPQVIDVTGKVVAPGFIDLHSHAQNIPGLRLQALDGVTTALELESGSGDLATSLAEAAAEGRPVNYGYSASWAQARMGVLDGAPSAGGFLEFTTGIAGRGWTRPAERQELARILDRLEQQIDAGALGIGVLVGYAPQTGRDEYMRVASLAARYDVPTFTHARFKNPQDPESALEGAAEVVAAAAGTGAHMHLCHVNSTSLRAIDEVADLIGGARSRGVSVTTEAYPYGAGMTAVGVPFLHPKNLKRLGIEPSNLTMIASGERPRDAERLLQIRRDTPGALAVIHYLDEGVSADRDVMVRALLLEDTVIASDAIPFTTRTGEVVTADAPLPDDAVSHPRSAGTFSRFLRSMVRETGALSLREALRRCSLLPAQNLQAAVPGMARKGRIQAGADADLVVFDPDTVSDQATYARPGQSSTGFELVLVAGQAVVRDGSPVQDSLPGRPILGGRR